MSPRTWITTTILGMLLACGAEADHQGSGVCVPGASAMCWCDGMTPGVQQCQPDMTFALCVCGGGTSGDDGSDPGDDTGTADGPATTDDGAGNQTGTPDPGTTGGGGESDGADADTGDPVPTDCSDELFSLWQACRQLASLHNPSTCGPCVGGNTCENAACNVDCAMQGNPGLEADLTDCDTAYPQCAGIFEQPTDPYTACVIMCGDDLYECLAAETPGCDPIEAGACSTNYSTCINGC